MAETTKKKQFVEIEYLGKTDGQTFDTNILEEAKKINPNSTVNPLKIIIGEGMLVPGFEKELEGKEMGKKYSIKIAPEEGYGKRNPKGVQLIPKNLFLEHKMNPVKGMTLTLDNRLAKVISVSGGRVMVDFNHPLAGKELAFDFTITKEIKDIKEKVDTLQQALFRQIFEYDLDETAKKIIFKQTELAQILNLFKDKFKDLLGYSVEIFVKKEKSDDKKADK